ncbi:hypothetical protein GF373_16780 [bacterium]|nr:hypothetical protein [bacterium]
MNKGRPILGGSTSLNAGSQASHKERNHMGINLPKQIIVACVMNRKREASHQAIFYAETMNPPRRIGLAGRHGVFESRKGEEGAKARKCGWSVGELFGGLNKCEPFTCYKLPCYK